MVPSRLPSHGPKKQESDTLSSLAKGNYMYGITVIGILNVCQFWMSVENTQSVKVQS